MPNGRPPTSTTIFLLNLNVLPPAILYKVQLNYKDIVTDILNDEIQCRAFIQSRKFRVMYGTSRENFTDYLSEFIWHKSFSTSRFRSIKGTIKHMIHIASPIL